MNKETTITLSIIIPTRNRAQLVSDLLDTLVAQIPVPFRWEALVIDNGSTDHTSKITKEKISSLPIEIRYIFEPKPGLHNGRHRGALEAKGKYLAYLDDDVLLTPSWINGINKLMSGQADAVVGRILPKWETRPPAWLAALIRGPEAGYLSLLDMGKQGFYIDPGFVYGDNFFITTQKIFELGGFHPDSMPSDQLRYRGDGESALMMKFKDAGLRAWYEPAATVYHRIPHNRISLGYMRKRSYAQGISDSFTEIRGKQYGNKTTANTKEIYQELPPKTFQFYIARIRAKSFHQLLASVATRILKFIPFSQPNIRERLSRAYLAGYDYHQNEVQKDPKLLKCVLQESFWDCKPEE